MSREAPSTTANKVVLGVFFRNLVASWAIVTKYIVTRLGG
jgi:hypothetical protein